MDITTKAYIAGIIDGEGSIGYYTIHNSRKPSMVLRIRIGNTNMALLQYIQSIYGGSINKQKSIGNRKQLYNLSFSQESGYQLTKDIFPFLIIKKEHAKLFLEMYDLKQKSNRNGAYDYSRQNAIISELKALNIRGIPI